jgi:hypothetical protein
LGSTFLLPPKCPVLDFGDFGDGKSLFSAPNAHQRIKRDVPSLKPDLPRNLPRWVVRMPPV